MFPRINSSQTTMNYAKQENQVRVIGKIPSSTTGLFASAKDPSATI